MSDRRGLFAEDPLISIGSKKWLKLTLENFELGKRSGQPASPAVAIERLGIPTESPTGCPHQQDRSAASDCIGRKRKYLMARRKPRRLKSRSNQHRPWNREKKWLHTCLRLI